MRVYLRLELAGRNANGYFHLNGSTSVRETISFGEKESKKILTKRNVDFDASKQPQNFLF